VGLIFSGVVAPDETYERRAAAFTAGRLKPSWPFWLILFSAGSWFKTNND